MNKETVASDYFYSEFIDGLRGLSIMMVALAHLVSLLADPWDRSAFFSLRLQHLIMSGVHGVQLFFVISAFTLFLSTSARKSRDARFSWSEFYVRRCFRIFPIFWVAVLIYGVLGHQNGILDYILNLTFLFGFTRGFLSPEMVPFSWSLFAEVVFYLNFWILFSTFNTVKKACIGFLVAIGVAACWLRLAPQWGIPDQGLFIDLFPLNQGYWFLLGILIFNLFTKDAFKVRWLNVTNAAVLRAAECATLLSVVFLFPFFKELYICTIPVFCLFVVAAHPLTWIGRIIRSRFLVRSGAYSYSIYLFHALVYRGCTTPITYLSSKLGALKYVEFKLLILFPVMASILYLVGRVGFHLVEMPSVKQGGLFLARQRAAKGALSV